ncbi:DUF4913 domain-containing protein [Arthrobacter sp. RCC_34]|uniref:DUF4913 domain-containing protein n=1 Tax=Arthrobacter sp. RCC_34 TaxID=3239230 RepID=UPI00352364E6
MTEPVDAWTEPEVTAEAAEAWLQESAPEDVSPAAAADSSATDGEAAVELEISDVDAAEISEATEDSPDSEEEPATEEEPEPAPAVVRGRDFLVSASEAAKMVSERLQKATSAASFRRMVINGDAPAPEEEDETTARWSQNVLDAWLDGIVAKAERGADEDADAVLVAPDGKDFYLSAAEGAALLSEELGQKITTATFRRMVMAGTVPEADIRTGGVPRWSQSILDVWVESNRPASASGELDDQREGMGFVLNVADAVALVAESAEPITPSRWRTLVMAGEAPAPLGWEPPRWDFAAVEAWIPEALKSGILKPRPAATSEDVPDPELVYGSTAEWVTKFLIPVYRRQIARNGEGTTWCPEWWKHAEAIIRLEALWRAWEHLRLDGRTGMSVWLKDHLDHHLPVLLSAKDGPFTGCKNDQHSPDPLKPFQIAEPPAEFFPDVREPKKNTKDEGGK